jgi:hypothetical protein
MLISVDETETILNKSKRWTQILLWYRPLEKDCPATPSGDNPSWKYVLSLNFTHRVYKFLVPSMLCSYELCGSGIDDSLGTIIFVVGPSGVLHLVIIIG